MQLRAARSKHWRRSWRNIPKNFLQKLAETIVELGIGDSAGVSIEEMAEIRQFRWVGLAGVWSQLRGETIPFDASPCGMAVERDKLLLIESPERFFAEAQVEPLIHEGLLVPFHVQGKPVGTLWININSLDIVFFILSPSRKPRIA